MSIGLTFVLDDVLRDVLGYIAQGMNQQSVREFSHSSRVSGFLHKIKYGKLTPNTVVFILNHTL